MDAGDGAGSAGHGTTESLHAERPPWQIGRPQAAFLALADAGAIRGRVLDAGCGTGEHALLVAAMGLDATGIDLAADALVTAGRSTLERGLTARFVAQDARRLADIGERFDTVLDCGLFHVLTGEDREAYVAGLRSILPPGGRYFMLGISDQATGRWAAHALSRAEIVEAFADGWRLESTEAAVIEVATEPVGIPAWLVAVTRTGTVEATVETERAERYLVQICQHAAKIGGGHAHAHAGHGPSAAPPEVHVEWSQTQGTLTFAGWGTCTLRATPTALEVTIEATDGEGLRRIREILTSDVARIGRRDGLELRWN